jgi:2,4-dienoyl-CoA reductase-like NADH-dependent reductase (Old Yellow Enzyme family)
MRLALRIIKVVVSVGSCDMLWLYRHTPVGWGYGIQESLILANKLVNAGMDILDISPATVQRPGDKAAPGRTRVNRRS